MTTTTTRLTWVKADGFWMLFNDGVYTGYSVSRSPLTQLWVVHNGKGRKVAAAKSFLNGKSLAERFYNETM